MTEGGGGRTKKKKGARDGKLVTVANLLKTLSDKRKSKRSKGRDVVLGDKGSICGDRRHCQKGNPFGPTASKSTTTSEGPGRCTWGKKTMEKWGDEHPKHRQKIKRKKKEKKYSSNDKAWRLTENWRS